MGVWDYGSLKRKVQLYADIPSHVVNPMVCNRARGVRFKILQTAQVILVYNVENIVGENVKVKQKFILFIGKPRAHSRVDQCISRCWCFRVVCKINAVLWTGKCCSQFYEAIYQVKVFIREVILKF